METQEIIKRLQLNYDYTATGESIVVMVKDLEEVLPTLYAEGYANGEKSNQTKKSAQIQGTIWDWFNSRLQKRKNNLTTRIITREDITTLLHKIPYDERYKEADLRQAERTRTKQLITDLLKSYDSNQYEILQGFAEELKKAIGKEDNDKKG